MKNRIKIVEMFNVFFEALRKDQLDDVVNDIFRWKTQKLKDEADSIKSLDKKGLIRYLNERFDNMELKELRELFDFLIPE